MKFFFGSKIQCVCQHEYQDPSAVRASSLDLEGTNGERGKKIVVPSFPDGGWSETKANSIRFEIQIVRSTKGAVGNWQGTCIVLLK